MSVTANSKLSLVGRALRSAWVNRLCCLLLVVSSGDPATLAGLATENLNSDPAKESRSERGFEDGTEALAAQAHDAHRGGRRRNHGSLTQTESRLHALHRHTGDDASLARATAAANRHSKHHAQSSPLRC